MSTSVVRQTTDTEIGQLFALLREGKARLVTIFGSVDQNRAAQVHYILDIGGQGYRQFVFPAEAPIPSATAVTPAASWYERELHDQYGIQIEGSPDLRPLVLHENWPDGVYPMRGEAVRAPWAQREYRFLQVQGDGVCEVPVGPVHAGIIEPGHFRFSVVGDTVLHLELRHFYTHKGTEKLFEATPVMNGPMIAESVSGDHCFAHAVAYSQAVETALDVVAPPRAHAIRLIGLELERMVAHIADVGALCGDVGFPVPATYNARIKEALLQLSTRVVGTRFWRGVAVPGGVTRDLTDDGVRELRGVIADAARDFAEMASAILDTPSVQNRFETTGVLSAEIARDLAVVGPVARASGIDIDVRRDHPYGRYREFSLEVPHYHYGDVLARARIRIDETAVSGRMIQETLSAMPAGNLRCTIPSQASGEAFSALESPRGELGYWLGVRDGNIHRCHIKSPSFQNWPALPRAMPGNIIADFPLINKSFNLSYSGCDR